VPDRTRRRLSRTLSRSRVAEYRSLLQTAIGHEYALVPVERFLHDPELQRLPRVLILRHDVDQHPRSSIPLAECERSLGVRSTWYLRWRTADPDVIGELRALGSEVGFHYETLTRRLLGRSPAGVEAAHDPALIDDCRAELRSEIVAFAELFGPLRSIAAHGDSRVAGVSNVVLAEGEGLADLGVYDANIAMRRHRLGCWLTDLSAAEGSWGNGARPGELLSAHVSPIQCLVHPNNWASGMSLWRDRARRGLLPAPRPGAVARIHRTRSDRPASPTGATTS
jgi:hypothetical protein